jgi:hypothetical protein
MTFQALVLKSFGEEPIPAERRSERRVAWIKRGTACHDGKTLAEVTLQDLSQTGCSISSNVAYAVGDRLELRFPNLPVCWGEVKWIRQESVGCHFDTPIASKDVHALTLATF